MSSSTPSKQKVRGTARVLADEFNDIRVQPPCGSGLEQLKAWYGNGRFLELSYSEFRANQL